MKNIEDIAEELYMVWKTGMQSRMVISGQPYLDHTHWRHSLPWRDLSVETQEAWRDVARHVIKEIEAVAETLPIGIGAITESIFLAD